MTMQEDGRNHERSPYAVPHLTMEQLRASKQALNRTGAQFLKTDLETALTFCKAARNTQDPQKKDRNQRFARKAYDTILRLMKKITLSDTDAKELNQKLERLKEQLVELGEAL